MEGAPKPSSPEDRELEAKLKELRAAYEEFKSRSFYEILGVPLSTDNETIKSAKFNIKLNLTFQVTEESPEPLRLEFNKIKDLVNEAYDTLTDPAKREEYDKGYKLEIKNGVFEGEIKDVMNRYPDGFNTFSSYENWKLQARELPTLFAGERIPDEEFNKSEVIKKLAVLGLSTPVSRNIDSNPRNALETFYKIADEWVRNNVLTKEEAADALRNAILNKS